MAEIKAVLLILAGLAALYWRNQWGRSAARQNARLWKMKTQDWWYIYTYTIVGAGFVGVGILALLGIVPLK